MGSARTPDGCALTRRVMTEPMWTVGVPAMTAEYLKVNPTQFSSCAVKSAVWDILMWSFSPSGMNQFHQFEARLRIPLKLPMPPLVML